MAGMSALPHPQYGRTLNVGLISGTVLIQPPGGRAFRLGQTDRHIPIGSLIDTRHGTVDLRAAATPDARGIGVQDGEFAGGRFHVRQQTSAPFPEVRLAGGSTRGCTATGSGSPGSPATGSSTVTTASRSQPSGLIRLLHAHGPGRFRTVGRNASATVRGTIWLTADYCNGTLVTVTAGVVAVRNLATGATVTLHARQSYFAAR